MFSLGRAAFCRLYLRRGGHSAPLFSDAAVGLRYLGRHCTSVRKSYARSYLPFSCAFRPPPARAYEVIAWRIYGCRVASGVYYHLAAVRNDEASHLIKPCRPSHSATSICPWLHRVRLPQRERLNERTLNFWIVAKRIRATVMGSSCRCNDVAPFATDLTTGGVRELRLRWRPSNGT